MTTAQNMAIVAEKPAVWVTRPLAQTERLSALLRAHGWEPIVAPLLAIEPTVTEEAARQWAEALDGHLWVFFVSTNAAQIAVPAIRMHRPWPPGPPVATVGAGSAAVLRALGFPDVWYPVDGADSEAVLAASWTQPERVAGQSLLIVKGEGGRGLLTEALRARGAEVHEWICYRRRVARWLPHHWEPYAQGRIAALLITSSEAARGLPGAMGAERFEKVRERLLAVANHPRVAEALQTLGWRHVVTAPRPGDDALVATLQECYSREKVQ